MPPSHHRRLHCSLLLGGCDAELHCSSCRSFCVGSKHPRVRFKHVNNNQRWHKFSLAFPFPSPCFLRQDNTSAGVGHSDNSSLVSKSIGEIAWAKPLTNTHYGFVQGQTGRVSLFFFILSPERHFSLRPADCAKCFVLGGASPLQSQLRKTLAFCKVRLKKLFIRANTKKKIA